MPDRRKHADAQSRKNDRAPRGSVGCWARGRLRFEDVRVTAHGVRSDLWQPGTITALDILLSLGEQEMLSRIGLQWYSSIAGANPVDTHFVELIEAEGFRAEASGGCGFVYKVGETDSFGFDGDTSTSRPTRA